MMKRKNVPHSFSSLVVTHARIFKNIFTLEVASIFFQGDPNALVGRVGAS
jgi:hypothetical protein